MALKVKDLFGNVGDGGYRLRKQFRFGDVEFVEDNPDIILAQVGGGLNNGDGFLPIKGESQMLCLSHIPEVKKLIDLFETIPCVYMCENLESVPYPSYVKSDDIVFGNEPLYPHKNELPHQVWCDDTLFKPYKDVKRIPRSVVIMNDQYEYLRLIAELSDSVLILGCNRIEDLHNYRDLLRYKDKIKCQMIPAEDEETLARLLSSVEFVISTQNQRGTELLGIEGLFCGAQLLIIDNGHYKENIYNGLDFIRYFDPESPFESITGALASPSSVGESEVKQAVDKFSAAKHVPLFWEQVKEILNKQGADHHVHVQPETL